MRVVNTVRAADLSDPGLQREHNEDRCHSDPQRGIFIVVDGVGGQAAGEKAVVEFFTEGVREAGDFSISCHRF